MDRDRESWLNPLSEDEKGPDAKGMSMWVVLTGGPIWDVVHGRSHPLWLAWPAILAAGALYVATLRLAFSDGWKATRITLPLLAAVTIAGAAGFQGNWAYLLIMLSVAIGTTVRGRSLPPLAFALCAVSVILQIRVGAGLADTLSLVWGVFTAAIIPAIIIRLWEAIRELQRTRRELAVAAVAEERLRFSRDLHDVLGHTLSVMVVKAEAVRRLAPVDAAAAAGQAADIEQIGRQALTEVRATVTGYRGRGLAAELESARTVLADAGVDASISTSVVRLPPETDALLGWAVREGVTNVIRHSGARSCGIDLRRGGGLVLEIRDDGSPSAGERPAGGGNGLDGLRERVTAVGGEMEAGPLPGRGFLLRVAVPEEEDAT
ncbi:sensor histidine kinase [Microbispora sp. NPDC049125]|uniref:sensor histidine kinase n=1 Tax=Microbispora sp. NPDC049125 TaxID=3154929 RepID=UPI003466C25E